MHQILKLSYYKYYFIDHNQICTVMETIKYSSWVAQMCALSELGLCG